MRPTGNSCSLPTMGTVVGVPMSMTYFARTSSFMTVLCRVELWGAWRPRRDKNYTCGAPPLGIAASWLRPESAWQRCTLHRQLRALIGQHHGGTAPSARSAAEPRVLRRSPIEYNLPLLSCGALPQ